MPSSNPTTLQLFVSFSYSFFGTVWPRAGYCQVGGGLVIGRAKWRYCIFCSGLLPVLGAIRFRGKAFFDHAPKLDQVPFLVYFRSTDEEYNKIEKWGLLGGYKL